MSDAIRRPRFDSWGSNYHGGGANKSCPLAGENIGTYFALERLQPAAMAQLAAARYRADDNQKARRLLRKNAAQSSKEIDDVRRSPRVLKNNSPPDHFGSRTGCLEIQLLERCLCCGFLLLPLVLLGALGAGREFLTLSLKELAFYSFAIVAASGR